MLVHMYSFYMYKQFSYNTHLYEQVLTTFSNNYRLSYRQQPIQIPYTSTNTSTNKPPFYSTKREDFVSFQIRFSLHLSSDEDIGFRTTTYVHTNFVGSPTNFTPHSTRWRKKKIHKIY